MAGTINLIGMGLYGAVFNLVGLAFPPLKEQGQAMMYHAWPTKRLDEGTNLQASYKGLIKPEEYELSMRELGYNPARSTLFKRASYYIPTFTDATRWAVREAFKDEYAAKYGTDQEFPIQLADYAVKAGVNAEEDNLKEINIGREKEEVLRLVPQEAAFMWRSHWELPPMAQAYDMYQRGIITYDELSDLFVAADVMPYWRKRMLDVAFVVPTRVDVRRMYGMKVLTIEQVYENYKKLGYSWKCPIDQKEITMYPGYCEEHATFTDAGALTEFTKRDYDETSKTKTAAERDLTKAELLKAYRKKQLSKNDTEEALKSLGYDDREAELLMTITEVDEESQARDLSSSMVTKLYKMGIIDRDEAHTQLRELGFEGESADYLLSVVEYESMHNPQAIPYSSLRGMFNIGILNLEEYRARLKGLGYVPEDTELILMYDLTRAPAKIKKEYEREMIVYGIAS